MTDSLIPYASVTGTRRNLLALRARGWRVLLSAAARDQNPRGFAYALDNGAWSYHQQGLAFDEDAFAVALRKLGGGADWTVVPDVVQGGAASLDLSLRWLPRVLDESPVALVAVQDGFSPEQIAPLLGPRVGIFVGGSTEWKLATLSQWARLGREHGAWVHVGRVNTARRIAHCAAVRATSFDGTSATRYAVTMPLLDAAVRQRSFNLEE